MFDYEFYYKGRYYGVRADSSEEARRAIRRDYSAQTERECFVTRVARHAQ